MADIAAATVEIDVTRTEGPRLTYPLPHEGSRRMWAKVPSKIKEAVIRTLGEDATGPFHESTGGQDPVALRQNTDHSTIGVVELDERLV